MTLSNLRTNFVFNKALEKHNKRWNTNLNQSDIYLLVALFICASRHAGGVTNISDVYNSLKAHKHTMSSNTIYGKVSIFVQSGFVKKITHKNYSSKYHLTSVGTSTLRFLTKEIRKVRPDKIKANIQSRHSFLD